MPHPVHISLLDNCYEIIVFDYRLVCHLKNINICNFWCLIFSILCWLRITTFKNLKMEKNYRKCIFSICSANFVQRALNKGCLLFSALARGHRNPKSTWGYPLPYGDDTGWISAEGMGSLTRPPRMVRHMATVNHGVGGPFWGKCPGDFFRHPGHFEPGKWGERAD